MLAVGVGMGWLTIFLSFFLPISGIRFDIDRNTA